MMEAAMTVKRYSAFPKTITSNPKSHFVFGVLPIAHVVKKITDQNATTTTTKLDYIFLNDALTSHSLYRTSSSCRLLVVRFPKSL